MSVLVAAAVLIGDESASAVGSYDNAAIANLALSRLGQQGGQCKTFANNIVWEASGHTQWPAPGYSSGFAAAGGVEVTAATAAKGDIIQVGESDNASPLHTAIVVVNKGGNTFNVVDSNWNWTTTVKQHDWTPPAGARIWRMGTVTAPPPQPPNDFDNDGVNDASDSCPYLPGRAANHGCPNSVAQVSGDIDGDGRDDVVSVSRGPDDSPILSWLPSASVPGTPSLTDPVTIGVNLPAPAWDVDTLKWIGGDFNGDGRDDLMTASGAGSGPVNMYLLLNNGGDLAAPVMVKNPLHPAWQWSRLEYFAADFDGDGKDDVYAVSRGPGNEPYINWFRSTSAGMTASLADGALLKSLPTPAWNVDALKWAVGDFDGNGRDDLFVGSGSIGSGPNMYVLASNGVSLADPTLVASPNPTYWLWDRLTFMAADIDGDTMDDIAYVSRGFDNAPAIGWFRSSSPSPMSPALTAPTGFTLAMAAPAWNVSNLKWAVGDHDGDGDEGIFVASGDNGNAVRMYILDADGSTLKNPHGVKDPSPQAWYWWRLQF
ncbi:FG-GAP repeat domain-containing protein [Catellatospora methionotrophica]|uniref:FG-GAP repeat domain-containing protein n=1 Tax=Catellatospora methionotrophica TaxID=121620 RepID=UPI0033DE6E6F